MQHSTARTEHHDPDHCQLCAPRCACHRGLPCDQCAECAAPIAPGTEWCTEHQPDDSPVWVQGHQHSEPVCAWPDCTTYLDPEAMAAARRAATPTPPTPHRVKRHAGP